jgi:uncharacterized repeat protein (TIGR03803 family)
MLVLAGFAPAGKPGFANRQEWSCFTERRASMKRIAHAFLGKLNWRKRAYAVVAVCATTAMALSAQTFTTLFSFDGTDGKQPGTFMDLVQATNGNLYGTAWNTVFKITPSGTLTTIYTFCSQSGCPDGEFPSGLIQAADGNLYGTAEEGGANGYGTVFKITPEGTLTTLHNFDGSDGNLPIGLVQAATGDFYGTTYAGGANNNPSCLAVSYLAGCGTVFKITPSGTLTTLYNFCPQSGCTDGIEPYAGLVQATNGDFYGTTAFGGANCAPVNGCGTVFKITPSGALTTLYSFCSQSGCTDGVIPYAGLVQTTNGDLYGTTVAGGANGYFGTVFKITPSGTLTTLYSFCSLSGCADGSEPIAGLVQGTDGNLYGTTLFDGANGPYDGTIFKITPSGSLTTLYSFCSQSGCTDGDGPQGGLVQDTNGTFYGTTGYGGAYNDGTVFSLSVGLGPFVETQRTSGKVGEVVEILGTDLTGATSVSFNGTPAAFTVISPSLIAATVPAGATTGKVQVVTPSGTLLIQLQSNVPFRVLP